MADWIGIELRHAATGAWVHSASFKTTQTTWTLPSETLSNKAVKSLQIKFTVIGRGRKIESAKMLLELPHDARSSLAVTLVVGASV